MDCTPALPHAHGKPLKLLLYGHSRTACRAPADRWKRGAQVRIEQVLLASPALLLCFRVSQLLTFYHGTVCQLLGSRSQVLTQQNPGPHPAHPGGWLEAAAAVPAQPARVQHVGAMKPASVST